MFPRILHQTWKDKDQIPDNFRSWRQSFFDQNPGLESRLYDDADNRALLSDTFPQLLPLYDSFPREIFRVDYIRPLYMFLYGGFYADMDFQCVRPLAHLETYGADLVTGQMGTDETFLHFFPNAFFASRPNQGFWLGYMAAMDQLWNARKEVDRIDERPEYVTGPVALRMVVLNCRRNPDRFARFVMRYVKEKGLSLPAGEPDFGILASVPGHVLYPLNWRDQVHRMFLRQMKKHNRFYTTPQLEGLFPSSVAVTYWTHSW